MPELVEVPHAPIELRYRPLLELGRGGTARVYLAESLASGLKKLVVLKTLEPELALDTEMRSLFRREAEVCARLNHPNIVQVHEVVEQATGPVIVMEYLEGVALSDVVAGSRTAPKRLYLHAITQLLAGLHYFHELKDYDRTTALNPVHRDVSPQNVIVLYEGAVKVLDFGICKLATAENATRTGVIKGKLHYMPAEQLMGDAAVDRRADIFSAGVMVWEALAGRRMWQDHGDNTMLRALINGTLPSLRKFAPDLPEHFYATVEKATAHLPKDRYATASELQIDVERILADMGGPVHPRDISEFMRDNFGERRREQEAAIEHAGRHPSSIVFPVGTANDVAGGQGRQESLSNGTSFERSATGATRAPWKRISAVFLLVVACVAGAGLFWVNKRTLATAQTPSATSASQQRSDTVSFSIASTPPGARALLDGNLLGLTPWSGTVPARTHMATLSVQMDGFEPFTQAVALSQDFSIDVQLQAHAQPAASTDGSPLPARKPTYKVGGGRTRPAGANPSSKPPTNANCNPPYTLSADGIRTYKAECF